MHPLHHQFVGIGGVVMFIVAFALFHEPSRAEKHCEQTFIKQCKVVVHGAALQARPESSAEAHAQCFELLDACENACKSRVSMCKAGMSAPMRLAERTARGTREPSSSPVTLRPEDHRAAAPGVVHVEF